MQVNNRDRLFYINDRFSFGALKSIIYYEFPHKSVQIEFHQTGLSMESNVTTFLYDNVSPAAVTLKVGQNTYSLKNNVAFPENPWVNSQLNRQARSKRIG